MSVVPPVGTTSPFASLSSFLRVPSLPESPSNLKPQTSPVRAPRAAGCGLWAMGLLPVGCGSLACGLWVSCLWAGGLLPVGCGLWVSCLSLPADLHFPSLVSISLVLSLMYDDSLVASCSEPGPPTSALTYFHDLAAHRPSSIPYTPPPPPPPPPPRPPFPLNLTILLPNPRPPFIAPPSALAAPPLNARMV